MSMFRYFRDELSQNVIRFALFSLILKLQLFQDFTNFGIITREPPATIYVGKRGAFTLGRRQPRVRGWSTFGSSNFRLSHSNARGMFLVSNERACFKQEFDAIFLKKMAKNLLF